MKYMVEHFRGPKALYNIASHGQGIYFTTDTNEIILNGVSYSGEGSEAFKALKTQVETNTGSLEVLTGNGEGSVLKMVDNAINEFATKISDDNTVNTFKELVDYAASHTSEVLQIVGEINDEFDEPDTLYEKLEENIYLFDGRTSLSDFYKITSLDSEGFEELSGEADTLAGMLLEVKGEFPQLHEVIVCNDVSFEVVQKDKHRIVKIKAILPLVEEGNGETQE